MLSVHRCKLSTAHAQAAYSSPGPCTSAAALPVCPSADCLLLCSFAITAALLLLEGHLSCVALQAGKDEYASTHIDPSTATGQRNGGAHFFYLAKYVWARADMLPHGLASALPVCRAGVMA